MNGCAPTWTRCAPRWLRPSTPLNATAWRTSSLGFRRWAVRAVPADADAVVLAGGEADRMVAGPARTLELRAHNVWRGDGSAAKIRGARSVPYRGKKCPIVPP